MVIKQHTSNVKTFVETKGIEDNYETFLQFLFPHDNDKLIELTFHGESERQDLLRQLQNIINELKIDKYWNIEKPPKVVKRYQA